MQNTEYRIQNEEESKEHSTKRPELFRDNEAKAGGKAVGVVENIAVGVEDFRPMAL